jgi:dihydrofolate reductase
MLWMQMSADGFAAASDGAFDWPVTGDEVQQYFVDELSKMGTFAYGATLFGWMASYWPNVENIPDAAPSDLAYSKIWVPMPKVVFSRTMEQADWNTTVASGDLAEEVAAAKARSDGDVAFFGGPSIANALLERDLIDEFRLFIHPVALGGGHRLFPTSASRTKLRLVEARTFDGTVAYVHWVRA